MKQQLKIRLLENYDYFIDNEYFDKYIDLLINNIDTQFEQFKTHKHHIVPRHYYSQKNLPLDNSETNLITLTIKDHMLAHLYMSACTEGRNRYWNFYSVFQMSGKNPTDFQDIQTIIPEYEQLSIEARTAEFNIRKGTKVSEETRLKMKVAQKKHVEEYGAYNKGKIWINNSEKELMINEDQLDYYICLGYVRGRIFKLTDELKDKMRQGYAHRTLTDEGRKKLADAARNRIHTEEERKRHSEYMKGRNTGDDNPSRRPEVLEKLQQKYQ